MDTLVSTENRHLGFPEYKGASAIQELFKSTDFYDDYVNIAKGVYILNHFIDGYVDTEYNIMDTENRLKD